ncbi:MAG: Bug family tripartite tricarboxylate transporter substrate binding protein [Candidatus Binatia bacterium]
MQTLRVRLTPIAGICFVILSSVALSFADEPFYKSKVMRIIVGFSAGGGFDTNSRILARHMGKHIPGSPTIVVDNMTGAGSQIAANHLYTVAKPDGLTIGNFAGGLFMNQVFNKPGVEFDARKFQYIGVPAKTTVVCALTRASGITSMKQWMAAKEPVRVGGLSPGNTTDDVPKILNATIGLPVRVVSGYKGTAKIRIAAETGEIAGGCWNWGSVRATWKQGLDRGDVAVVLQAADKPHPELPKVPLAISYAKTDEARKLMQVGIHDQAQILRIYALPPNTPKERLETLRSAYLKTMKDPAFIAEMTKTKQPVDPVTGEELERIIRELFELPPALAAKLKETLK